MCYTTTWEPLPDDSFTFNGAIRDLRYWLGLAQTAKTQYDVLPGNNQSICEHLLLSLEEARRYKAKYLSEGRKDLVSEAENEAENRYLLPLFADIEIDSSSHAAYLLRQLPQFQDWYDPKEGDVATVLHPDNRKSIRRKFYKGSWIDIVSLNTNLA